MIEEFKNPIVIKMTRLSHNQYEIEIWNGRHSGGAILRREDFKAFVALVEKDNDFNQEIYVEGYRSESFLQGLHSKSENLDNEFYKNGHFLIVENATYGHTDIRLIVGDVQDGLTCVVEIIECKIEDVAKHVKNLDSEYGDLQLERHHIDELKTMKSRAKNIWSQAEKIAEFKLS
uniref:Uncharacterized protein n=1 Tax=Rhizobium phage LG08 TaxID=3129229 RepID=A0AAU8HY49_9CAUD